MLEVSGASAVHKVKSIGSVEAPDTLEDTLQELQESSHRAGYIQGLLDAADVLFKKYKTTPCGNRLDDALDVLKLQDMPSAADTKH